MINRLLWIVGLSALVMAGCESDPVVTAVPEVTEAEIDRYERSQGRTGRAGQADEDGSMTTPSGLRYRVIREGTGRTPGHTDTVTVHYTGWLEDGTVFDSSLRRGRPATFPVDGVIAGWTEALKLMKEGGKMRLVVPPYLGYGAKGAGELIGPNETLYFEIELIRVR